jgi:tRNA 2-selenouridine synthase
MNQDAVTVTQLTGPDALRFDDVVDVRSPAEFALDHLPGAINCPVLDDEERARIGTIYVQDSPFLARKIGAALVARNIARLIEQQFFDKPRGWRPLVYCWRGGQRSAAMIAVLRQVGWDARRLIGGYKAYRSAVIAGIEERVPRLRYRVICGLTGSGKSALLAQLQRQGAQTLDLEQLASHRGSLLGSLPGAPQPSQKMFESRLWQALRQFDSAGPVFVESESRKVGNLRVPEALIASMRRSDCIWLEAATPVRVARLLADYRHFTENAEALCQKLDCLVALHGRDRINAWKDAIAAAQWPAFVTRILEEHYDPAYRKSIAGHYPELKGARCLRLYDGSEADFVRAARELLEDRLVPAG